MASDSDEEAFAEYFAARLSATRRIAYLMCGDWHWADDLTQVAFVRLAAAWHRVRDYGALDAFVRTCLVRAFLAETRRSWRKRERSFAEVMPQTNVMDSQETTAHRLEIARALAEIPPRQRAVLVLRFYEDLDVAETSRVLHCAEGTVKSQTARGLAALRAALGNPSPAMLKEVWS
jgi:RNA polymerase sigma-70 factor (sigma-E family)